MERTSDDLEADAIFEEEDREDEERQMERYLPFERLVEEEKSMRAEIIALRRHVRRLEREKAALMGSWLAATERASSNMLLAALAGAFDQKPEAGKEGA